MSWGDILSLLSTVAIGLFLFYWQRKQTRLDKLVSDRAAARKRESLLSLDLTMANGKLSYATAMAIKRGAPNGEIEEGVVAYEAARKQYITFLNEQAADHITEG